MVVMETISRQLVWTPIQKEKKLLERVTFLPASLMSCSSATASILGGGSQSIL